jgi:hypothetical protein
VASGVTAFIRIRRVPHDRMKLSIKFPAVPSLLFPPPSPPTPNSPRTPHLKRRLLGPALGEHVGAVVHALRVLVQAVRALLLQLRDVAVPRSM